MIPEKGSHWTFKKYLLLLCRLCNLYPFNAQGWRTRSSSIKFSVMSFVFLVWIFFSFSFFKPKTTSEMEAIEWQTKKRSLSCVQDQTFSSEKQTRHPVSHIIVYKECSPSTFTWEQDLLNIVWLGMLFVSFILYKGSLGIYQCKI